MLSLSYRFDLLLRPATTSYLFPVREQFQSAVSPDRTIIAAANHGSQGMQLLSHIKKHTKLHRYLACIAVNKTIRQMFLALHILKLAFPAGMYLRRLGFRLLLACDVHPACMPDLQVMTQRNKILSPTHLHVVMMWCSCPALD